MSPASTGLLFGLGLLLGGAALIACDPSNPWGVPSSSPSRPCEIMGAAEDPCLDCERTYCCTAVEECAQEWEAECLELANCWQGRSICPVYHDGSGLQVDDCIRKNCTAVCPGGLPS